MINYKLKSSLIDSKIYNDYIKVSKAFYNHNAKLWYDDFKPSDNVMPIDIASQLHRYYSNNFPVEWKECQRIYSAQRNRVRRLRKRIEDMIQFDCIFLTLTFTDFKLNSTSESTRRYKVKRFLNELNCPYVANKDFGKKNHREHYHAVVQCSSVDYSKWSYGAINGLRIRNSTEDLTRISKYVAKLTNHAIKETTKRSAIMYSRHKK